jgi:hypothetical protein
MSTLTTASPNQSTSKQTLIKHFLNNSPARMNDDKSIIAANEENEISSIQILSKIV